MIAQPASPKPFEGRYPCANLMYNGVWYYGTYCLGPKRTIRHEGFDYNWPILGPMLGFRFSTDRGKTWTPSPFSPERPLFPEPAKRWGAGEMGGAALRRFRQEHGAFARRQGVPVGMGAEDNDPKPRYANLSWISADQVYLARVTPSIENINDIKNTNFSPATTQRASRLDRRFRQDQAAAGLEQQHGRGPRSPTMRR